MERNLVSCILNTIYMYERDIHFPFGAALMWSDSHTKKKLLPFQAMDDGRLLDILCIYALNL